MMGRLNRDQGELFYSFCLDEVVPDDHLVRGIAAVLDLSWVHAALAPYYSSLGRPSIDPALMIRMLIVGYVFAIRSERLLCREVKRLGRSRAHSANAWRSTAETMPHMVRTASSYSPFEKAPGALHPR
jgi:hypothetical protein